MAYNRIILPELGCLVQGDIHQDSEGTHVVSPQPQCCILQCYVQSLLDAVAEVRLSTPWFWLQTGEQLEALHLWLHICQSQHILHAIQWTSADLMVLAEIFTYNFIRQAIQPVSIPLYVILLLQGSWPSCNGSTKSRCSIKDDLLLFHKVLVFDGYVYVTAILIQPFSP